MEHRSRYALLFATLAALPDAALATPGYDVIGQPNTASSTLASRCAGANARFTQDLTGFEQDGPSGIALDEANHVFVTDFAGDRVLVFNQDVGGVCPVASEVIGAGTLDGPEAAAWDAETATLYVADSFNHVVRGFRKSGATWNLQVTLGVVDTPGSALDHMSSPRGLAIDGNGRLFVADDDNGRVLIFDPPISDGASAADVIDASADGGFGGPKALAIIGPTLFVADYYNSRVLRFTGPFLTPGTTYVASGVFTGVTRPVDLAIHPDGALMVMDHGADDVFAGLQHVARYDDAAISGNRTAPDSTFADNIGPEPLGLAVARSGRVFIADYRGFRVLVRNEAVATAAVDPLAGTHVTDLLRELQDRPNRGTNRVAIGQQLIDFEYPQGGDPEPFYQDWKQLEDGGFALPRIMAGELGTYMSYAGFSPNTAARDRLLEHHRRGGIVTLVWHPDNPTGGGAFTPPLTTLQLQQMIDDNTAVGQAWQVQLNRAAAALQVFAAAGVPVLFRPLHEQNTPFFWWGYDGSSGDALRQRQAAWVAMWRDLVHELTVTKGLHNLAFLFGANQVTYDGIAPPLLFYPGGSAVDAVGIDIYDEELDMAGGERGLRHYQALTATGRPFGIPEFGQAVDYDGAGNPLGTGLNADQWDARTLTTRISDSYPRTAFASAWYSQVQGAYSYVWALPDVSFTQEMLGHPLIETQSQAVAPLLFTRQPNAPAGAFVYSNTLVMTGLAGPTPISITGHASAGFSINNTTVRNTPTTISNGDRVRLRIVSAAPAGAQVFATLTVGDRQAPWTVTTLTDTTPNPLVFPAVTGVASRMYVYSATITVGGINAPANVSLFGKDAAFSIDGAAFRTTATTINNGQKIRIRTISSSTAGAAVSATLTIGNVTGVFSVVRAGGGGDTVPGAFAFTTTNNAVSHSFVYSNTITLAGTNQAALLELSPGTSATVFLFSVNGSPFTASPPWVNTGDKIRLRAVSATAAGGSVSGGARVGGPGGTTAGWTVNTAP
jgi:hypothetical protein